MSKNMSVRLPEDLYTRAMTVAMVDEVSIGEIIREALVGYTAMRSGQEEFRIKADRVRAEFQQKVDALLELPADAAAPADISATAPT